MRIAASLSLLVALLAVPLVAGAQSLSSFHLQLNGTLPLPFGSYPGSKIDKASDVLGVGAGFAVGASLDVGRHWGIGARSGLFRNTKEFAGTIRFRGGAVLPAEFRRKVTSIPANLLIQYRTALGSRMQIEGVAGAGVMSFAEKVRLRATGFDTNVLAEYQNSLDYVLGAGVSYPGFGAFGLTGGLDFYQAITKDGQVWSKRDNPKFLVGSLGIRYPR